MIKRALRLPLGNERMRNGEAITSPFFLLKFRPNTLSHHRFAVVVGIKAGKTAVVRHIIKRTVLDEAATWPSREGATRDFLFIALPRLKELAKPELKEAIRKDLVALYRKLPPVHH